MITWRQIVQRYFDPITGATEKELRSRIAELEDVVEAQTAERKELIQYVRELRAQLQTSYEQEVNSRGRQEIVKSRDKWMRIAQEAQADVERYKMWKVRGLNHSNGYYQLEIYIYSHNGERECGNADDIADMAIDAAMEGMKDNDSN